MTDLPEEEREAFRRAFPPPFDDLGPAGVCTCDTYPLPIEDHGDECAVRALYEGWMARREYSKQREEKLREALRESDEANRNHMTHWLTVAPILEAHVYEPRDDGYIWNAWTRWGKRACRHAESARKAARAALAENGDTVTGQLGDRRPGA